jgi:hypothetical protein
LFIRYLYIMWIYNFHQNNNNTNRSHINTKKSNGHIIR